MKPSAQLLFTLTPYAPSAHGAFVRSTWAWGALRNGSREARERLDELLRTPGARCLLAHASGNPDRFAGWAARTSDALIFAFVLPVVRGRGLGAYMARALGFDTARPVPVMHWTPTARELAAHGKPVFFAPSAECSCPSCVAAHPPRHVAA